MEKEFATIHFDMDKTGRRVIGRLKSGKVCIISYNYKGPKVGPGDDWHCEVQEMDNKAIVIPLQLIASAKENEKLMEAGLTDLLTKDWNHREKNKRK